MKSGATPLVIACQKSFIRIAQNLLDRGANIEAAGANFLNSLHLAILAGNNEVVALLLGRGANPDARGGPNEEFTPLHLAVRRKSVYIASLLVRYGADFTEPTLDVPTEMARVFDGVIRIECKIIPIGQTNDVATLVHLSSASTLKELYTRASKIYKKRVVAIFFASTTDRYDTTVETQMQTPLTYFMRADSSRVTFELALRDAEPNAKTR